MKIDVTHVAKLANVPILEEEKKKLSEQLHSILDYIDLLNTVDTKNIEPTHQVTGLENVTTEDIPQSSLPQKAVLANAQTTHNDFFKVKGIFNDE